MARPPEDERWSDVLSQVNEALRGLGLSSLSGEQRRSLEAGLDQAIADLSDVAEESAAPPTAAAPALRLVEGEPDQAARGPSDAGADERSTARVRVVRPRSEGADAQRGVIALSPGARQTIFRAASPRAYRIWCTAGALEVSLDGLPADRLEAGQSLDTEAKLIRISSSGAARGSYWRLERRYR